MSPSPEAYASLDEWLEYLESIHSMEIELGLERVLLVYRRLLPRGCSARVVTVAGTNGKGSTVHALERLLRAEGRSTGAYTSPHIERFNERMRINGNEVSDAGITDAFSAVEQARQGHERGVISRRERDAIIAARRAGRQPPQNTALGGHIGLHGVNGNRTTNWNWTEGCVALMNDQIDILTPWLRPGTHVIVV